MMEPVSEDDKAEISERKIFWRGFFTGKKLFFLVPLLLAAFLGAGYGHYTDPGPASEGKALIIPHGGAKNIAGFLQQEGFLAKGYSSRIFFSLAVLLTKKDGALHAAEFNFPPHASIAHILSILRHAPPVSHYLTIPEGLTARHIAHLVMQAPALQGDVPVFEEGSVFPQTFSYVWGMKREALVKKAQSLMNENLRNIWDGRDQNSLADIITTPEQLLILASLIERETGLEEERPLVARVFINRLRKNMRLQTDPTVIYALSDGSGRLARPLMHDDLDVESPYNTYKIVGLPPGPICSPGLASLKAAAHPAEGTMLYFVASGRGGHQFSDTLAEHNAHIRAYHKLTKENVENPAGQAGW